jgi:hypothetical protein
VDLFSLKTLPSPKTRSSSNIFASQKLHSQNLEHRRYSKKLCALHRLEIFFYRSSSSKTKYLHSFK